MIFSVNNFILIGLFVNSLAKEELQTAETCEFYCEKIDFTCDDGGRVFIVSVRLYDTWDNRWVTAASSTQYQVFELCSFSSYCRIAVHKWPNSVSRLSLWYYCTGKDKFVHLKPYLDVTAPDPAHLVYGTTANTEEVTSGISCHVTAPSSMAASFVDLRLCRSCSLFVYGGRNETFTWSENRVYTDELRVQSSEAEGSKFSFVISGRPEMVWIWFQTTGSDIRVVCEPTFESTTTTISLPPSVTSTEPSTSDAVNVASSITQEPTTTSVLETNETQQITGSSPKKSDGSSLGIILTVVIIVLLLIACIVAVVVIRRRRLSRQNKTNKTSTVPNDSQIYHTDSPLAQSVLALQSNNDVIDNPVFNKFDREPVFTTHRSISGTVDARVLSDDDYNRIEFRNRKQFTVDPSYGTLGQVDAHDAISQDYSHIGDVMRRHSDTYSTVNKTSKRTTRGNDANHTITSDDTYNRLGTVTRFGELDERHGLDTEYSHIEANTSIKRQHTQPEETTETLYSTTNNPRRDVDQLDKLPQHHDRFPGDAGNDVRVEPRSRANAHTMTKPKRTKIEQSADEHIYSNTRICKQ